MVVKKINGFVQITKIALLFLCTIPLAMVQAEPVVYVTNALGASVSVIDTESGTVTHTIALEEGAEPVAVAVHPFENFAYVNDRALGVVHVLDTETHTKIYTIPLDNNPDAGVKFHPDGSRAYVTHRIRGVNGEMSIIDTSTHQVITTLEMGRTPSGVAIHPDNIAYVCNFISNDIYIVDLDTNIITDILIGGFEPQGLTITPDSQFVYVSNKGDGTISVIDTSLNQIITTIDVGDSPGLIDFSLDSALAYVPLRGERDMAIIDTATHTIIEEIDVEYGGYVWAALLPSANHVYMANQNRDSVGVIDLETKVLTQTIDVGEFPIGLAVVSSIPLEIDTVNPGSVKQGEASALLTVTGSGFSQGVEASIPRARGVTVNTVTFVDEETVLLEIAVEIDATVSQRNLIFSNPDGQTFTKKRAFRVTRF